MKAFNINSVVSIVCPCYNEEDSIDVFLDEVIPVLLKLKLQYEVIFVNDGSEDKTFETMINAKKINNNIRIINLSRNFGKESALTAGLCNSKGDVVIPMDVDLQDPPELIYSFVEKWKEGYDVVIAKRIDRSSDGLFKRLSAKYFYTLHQKISDVHIPANVGDYRLMTKRVVLELNKLPENQRYMKGLFSWIGYKTATIEYKRMERSKGNSSFSVWKLWELALEGVTSFSTTPLKISLYTGTLISLISFAYGAIIFLKALFFDIDTPGYASLLIAIIFFGGIQLISIGILGEYIGRIYKESKRRPSYVIEDQY
jgi:polyisoprenyl-phosphate glycosyltransferase